MAFVSVLQAQQYMSLFTKPFSLLFRKIEDAKYSIDVCEKFLAPENDDRVRELMLRSNSNVPSEQDVEQCRERLRLLRNKRTELAAQRQALRDKYHEAALLRREIEKRLNTTLYALDTKKDQLASLECYNHRTGLKLHQFLQLNPINDAFHIWFVGPFATINNFRLGKLSTHQVEWVEINAALGQAALAVSTVAEKIGIVFKKYVILPMGNFSRITRVDDRKVLYNLFSEDSSFNLFRKQNVNMALVGFLTCIEELGEYIIAQDPTLQFPYKINATEGKVNNHCILLYTEDEQWTRGLKFMLSNIKWVIAWSAKHVYGA